MEYGTGKDVGWRVQRERANRGLSYRALAEKMSEAGCPIQPSALQRIETGYPREPEKRPKIGVEELIAFCRVFGIEPADLLRSREAVEDEETTRLAAEYRDRATALADGVLGIASFYRRVGDLSSSRGAEGVRELRNKTRLHVEGLSRALEPYGFDLSRQLAALVTSASLLGSELAYQERRQRGEPAAPYLERTDLDEAGLGFEVPHDWDAVLREAGEALSEWENDQKEQRA